MESNAERERPGDKRQRLVRQQLGKATHAFSRRRCEGVGGAQVAEELTTLWLAE
jgi:hypothetical protein